MAIETPYMTRNEAAAYLRVSVRTLDSRIKEGRVQAYRIGHSVLLLQKDLDEYVQRKA
jgi:excisionase family DNA binding protein